jgi:hypothetical protein
MTSVTQAMVLEVKELNSSLMLVLIRRFFKHLKLQIINSGTRMDMIAAAKLSLVFLATRPGVFESNYCLTEL